MKKALIFLLVIGSFLDGKGQSKYIELYDLVRSLLPDSTAASGIVKWTDPSIQVKGINWQSTTPVNNEGVYSMRGSLPLSINNSTFSCEVNSNRPCPFKLYLEGNDKGYTKISLDHLPSTEFNPEQQISFLFPQSVRWKIYRKNQDTGMVKVYTYEIRIPGRRTAWMMYATMKSPLGNSIYLKIYLSEKLLREEEQRKSDTGKLFIKTH